MSLIGNGEGNTLLILTDAESRLIRSLLTPAEDVLCAATNAQGLAAFNRGVIRGAERLAKEFNERNKK